MTAFLGLGDQLLDDDEDHASTKEVADRLSVSPASVTNMFGRLQEMGLVGYERYRGTSLTRRGLVEALRLVRWHRLIETFLLEHLGYSWQDVHEEAEKLEHAVSNEFTERLGSFWGIQIATRTGTSYPRSMAPSLRKDLSL